MLFHFLLIYCVDALIYLPLKEKLRSSSNLHDSKSSWLLRGLSSSAKVTNIENNQYYVDAEIGTPPQKFSLLVSLRTSWILIDSKSCESCRSWASKFDSDHSSTFKSGNNYLTIDTVGRMKGNTGNETVRIGELTANSQGIVLVDDEYGTDDLKPDGIFGLGFSAAKNGASSILSTLYAQRDIKNLIFSLYLNDSSSFSDLPNNGESMLIIDGYDISKYAAETEFTYLNAANSDGFWELDSECVIFGQKIFAGGYKARISPGTSYILGPQNVISEILRLLEANYACSANGLGKLNCNCNEKYPDFIFQLSGVKFRIKSAGYLQKADTYCYPTFDYSTTANTWIIGDAFLRRFYTLYDMPNKRVGFATVGTQSQISTTSSTDPAPNPSPGTTNCTSGSSNCPNPSPGTTNCTSGSSNCPSPTNSTNPAPNPNPWTTNCTSSSNSTNSCQGSSSSFPGWLSALIAIVGFVIIAGLAIFISLRWEKIMKYWNSRNKTPVTPTVVNPAFVIGPTQTVTSLITRILNRVNNPETEDEYRKTLSIWPKNGINNSDDWDRSEFMNAYYRVSSLYFLRQTSLIVYNTENQTEKEIVLENIPENLQNHTCITYIPDSNLFCFGNYPASGITFIIHKDHQVESLRSGTPCSSSSATYFNNNVYCFGGKNGQNKLTLSERFDLKRERWYKLKPLPQPDWECHCLEFNNNILIAGRENQNILRYSIINNSFEPINGIDFEGGVRKILINAGGLLLIECYNKGKIYESKNDDISWVKIADINEFFDYPSQVYCSYNKEAIYIGCRGDHDGYYKFSLDQKTMIRINEY